MKISSIDKDIKGILGSSYYRIPRFQRPYSWDRDNISDFWNDTIQDSESDYFIGSVVVFKFDGDMFGVVDGQQRLTTITMILAALRNSLEREGFSDLARGVHHLIERRDIDNEPRYILSTESSFPYFQEYIQKFGTPTIDIQVGEEEEKIQGAFKQIEVLINSAVKAIKDDTTLGTDTKNEKLKDRLIGIRDKLLGLKLIFVDLDEEDDAYIIFETLNTRGKDLSVADLVKNHLMKLLKPKNVGVDTPRIQWERILETIEGSQADIDIDGFLHHYWLSKHEYVTAKKLFREVKKSVRKADAQHFLNELENDARTYREIHDTAFRKWRSEQKPIKQALDALSLFRVKQQVPIVLSVMRDYKAGKLKQKHVEKILKAIENFHFIFTAVTSQRSSGGISQMYAASAKRLVNATGLQDKLDVIDELHTKLHDMVPTFDEFQLYFKDIFLTNTYTKEKSFVKYILSRLDAHLNVGSVLDYTGMTIEHLIPQNSIGTHGLTTTHVGQIGNLVLVPPALNNKLGTKSFQEKKRLLSNAKVYLDNALTSKSEWGKDQIELRTDWLAKLSYEEIWNL